MDKQTLSNYGWIVIAVLVLVVMIALAGPFGTFVSEAVQSTTKGLFDVNKSALDNTGLIELPDQEFEDPNAPTMITFTIRIATNKVSDTIQCRAEEGMTIAEWLASKYVAETGYTARGKDLYKGETDCGWINYGTVSAVIEAGKTYWCNFDLPPQPL